MPSLSRLRSSLCEELRAFDPDCPIETCTPPPASWYTDPAFLELERHTTFVQHWQFVGRADQVAAPGDYFTGSVTKRPFVVVRDETGVLRGFYNVCAHHGTRVASGCGSARELTCPYHGWQYHLSGELKRVPRSGAVSGLREGEIRLLELPVAVVGPFVLAFFGAAPAPDLPIAAELTGSGSAGLGLDGLQFVTRRTFAMDCNWKVFVDNYLDGGYHVPHMHAELSASLDLDGYASQLGDRWALQTCPPSAGAAQRVAGERGEPARYLWVHPNFMINRYGPWMDTNTVLPTGVDRCVAVFDYYHDGPLGEAAASRALRESERVQREDTEIVVRVQEGLESGVYAGRYAARFEAPMLHFHRLLAADLAV